MTSGSDAALLSEARASKAWPFEQARKIVDRLKRRGGDTHEVIFQTG